MIYISTRFFLVRHGETDWNRSDRFRGRSDIGLTEQGRWQAEQVAARLATRYGPVAAIYSSPLPRALQTAEPIAAAHHLIPQAEADLLDIDYGAWEGLSAKEAEEKYPDLYAAWLERPGRVRFPAGESTRQVRVRIESLLNRLNQDHYGENVVLVSHRITCHVILCYALGLSNDHLWRIKQELGCLNIIERRDEAYTVTLMNDTNHLPT